MDQFNHILSLESQFKEKKIFRNLLHKFDESAFLKEGNTP